MTQQRHSWRRRRLCTAAAVGGCLALGVWAARRLGLPEVLSGLLLEASIIGVLVTLAAAMAQRCGVGRPEALGWMIALFVASVSPLLTSIHPGPILGQAALSNEGDELEIGANRAGPITVSVAAGLPEGISIAFSLRVGPELVEGRLSRGTRRWSAGPDSRHFHEDRTAVLLDVDLRPGVQWLVLEHSSGPAVPLFVRVYSRVVPAWFVLAASLGTLFGFAWRVARLGGGRESLMVATVAVLAGLGAGSIATPERAFGAVIGGLALGLVAGIPLAAATVRAATGIRRGR